MTTLDPAVLVTALLAGLLGSGHCFGMCGGIAGSLGALSGIGSRRSLVWPAVQFNLGRLLGLGMSWRSSPSAGGCAASPLSWSC
jgi:sulfite exporter TauE/SafE